eukprot:COSAG06_NODE_5508_length_3436_cov_9.349364_1_plen_103_part_00
MEACTRAWQQLFAGSAAVLALSSLIFMALGSADSIDHKLVVPLSSSSSSSSLRDEKGKKEEEQEPTRPPPARMRVAAGRGGMARSGRDGLSASGYTTLGGSE